MGGKVESRRQGPHQSLVNNHSKFGFKSMCSGKPLEGFKQRSNMIIYVLKRFWQLCKE